MPIYDYRCTKCKNEFEKIKGISESENPDKCPECESEAERIFVPKNTAGKMTFVLRGWGWSNDGYAGVSKHWKSSEAQRKIFNADGTDKAMSGDKRDWKPEPIRSFIGGETKKGKVKPGRKRIMKT